jgi:hypothetical protein
MSDVAMLVGSVGSSASWILEKVLFIDKMNWNIHTRAERNGSLWIRGIVSSPRTKIITTIK